MVSGSTCEWEGETAFDGAQTFEKEGGDGVVTKICQCAPYVI
jgi:hypothetical protein